LPNWTAAHRELKRRGVTLLPLWEEYRAEHADSARGLVRRANARV
jgi:transposase